MDMGISMPLVVGREKRGQEEKGEKSSPRKEEEKEDCVLSVASKD